MDDDIDDLRRHSVMLGQIASEVSEWCDDPHCTTLSAVRLMKAELYRMRAEHLEKVVDEQVQSSYAP